MLGDWLFVMTGLLSLAGVVLVALKRLHWAACIQFLSATVVLREGLLRVLNGLSGSA